MAGLLGVTLMEKREQAGGRRDYLLALPIAVAIIDEHLSPRGCVRRLGPVRMYLSMDRRQE